MWYLEYRQSPYKGAQLYPEIQQVPLDTASLLDYEQAVQNARAALEEKKKGSGYPEGFSEIQLTWREALPPIA